MLARLFTPYPCPTPDWTPTPVWRVWQVYEVADRVAVLCQDWPPDWGPRDEGSICVVAAYAEQVRLGHVMVARDSGHASRNGDDPGHGIGYGVGRDSGHGMGHGTVATQVTDWVTERIGTQVTKWLTG